MRENATVVLDGAVARLVPYLRCHVGRYHAWMQDEELLRLTCSEQLTLEEEQANQQSWLDDPLKLTFIVCAERDASPSDPAVGMCGDVNAFLFPVEPEIEDDESQQPPPPPPPPRQRALHEGEWSAELEVMIAEPSRRRSGLARDSLLLMMHWLLEHVPRISFLVRKALLEHCWRD